SRASRRSSGRDRWPPPRGRAAGARGDAARRVRARPRTGRSALRARARPLLAAAAQPGQVRRGGRPLAGADPDRVARAADPERPPRLRARPRPRDGRRPGVRARPRRDQRRHPGGHLARGHDRRLLLRRAPRPDQRRPERRDRSGLHDLRDHGLPALGRCPPDDHGARPHLRPGAAGVDAEHDHARGARPARPRAGADPRLRARRTGAAGDPRGRRGLRPPRAHRAADERLRGRHPAEGAAGLRRDHRLAPRGEHRRPRRPDGRPLPDAHGVLALMADPEKTEKATPKRRQKALGEGRVAKSNEVNQTAVLLATLLVLAFEAPKMLAACESIMHDGLARTGNPSVLEGGSGLGGLSSWGMTSALHAVYPVALAAVAAGVIAGVAQAGFHFRTKALKPSFSRLNVARGLKQMVSKQKGVELLKSLAKLAVVGAVAGLTLWSRLPHLGLLVG